MSIQQDEALYRRVEELETAVWRLQRQVDAWHSPTLHEPVRGRDPSVVRRSDVDSSELQQHSEGTSSSKRSTFDLSERLKVRFSGNGEALLNRMGIGLLLMGVAFLFKYSVDQGWITEMVRLIFGVGLGTFLLVAAVRITPQRPRLASILNGGGIAILYGTAYVAYALYGIIDASTAFGYLVGVTALAFLISIYQHEAPLSVVATLGGLAAPLLIPAEDPSLIGLSAYVSLIVVGTTATYVYRGWLLPLFTAAAAAWVVLLFGYLGVTYTSPLTDLERFAFQGSVIVYGLAFGCFPVVRELLHERAPTQYPSPHSLASSGIGVMRRPALSLSVTTPFIVLGLSEMIWPWSAAVWGWISMLAAVAYLSAATAFDGHSRSNAGANAPGTAVIRLAQSHRFASAALLTMGLLILCDAPWLVPALAIEAVLVDSAARKWRDGVLKTVALVLFIVATLLFLAQVASRSAELMPLFNAAAAAELIMLAAWAVYSAVLKSGRQRLAIALVAHVLFLNWMLAEIGAVPSGQAYVTVAWGAYAALLFILGLRKRIDVLRIIGLLTLLAAVGKLLVFDLATLDAIWRILLFLGFGGGLLLLSYYVPALWKSASVDNPQTVKA